MTTGLRSAVLDWENPVAIPLLVVGAALVLVQPSAGQSGAWTETGDLITARWDHTATLLPDGMVLVAGGGANVTALASAELYNPESGTWTETGDLANARQTHTATLLPNGQVLVAGGQDSIFGDVLASTELYNPESGTWTETGDLANARQTHTATLLPNGQVLVAGGQDSFDTALASAEFYDPASGTWTETGDLADARFLHTATLLPNGEVLVTGGEVNSFTTLASAELYDPAGGTWMATASLAHARRSHTATLLPNGQVLVAGGIISDDILASAELYDPASGTWTETASLAHARQRYTATLLPNGKVLVAGGQDSSFNGLASAELYDPASGTWTETGSLVNARWDHTATLLSDGQVLVAGGGVFEGSTSAELYDPASGTWTETGDLVNVRFVHTATLLSNGKVLAAGGLDGHFPPIPTATAELYTSDGGGSCVPPPAGLVSWWSGDNTADDVQGINPGVLKSGASFRPGIVGLGFLLDGIDDSVLIPDSPSLNPRDAITLNAWVFWTGQQGNIFAKDGEVFNRQYKIGAGGQVGGPFFRAHIGVPSGYYFVDGTTVLTTGTWYHVAETYNGAFLKLYVNGGLDASIPVTGRIITTSQSLYIGDFVAPMRGRVDEAQIFDRALTDAEILAIYQAGADGQCKPNIFVASIDPSYTVSGHGFRISTSILIQDVNGVGINDATVRLGIILPSGLALTLSPKTDATGRADVSSKVADSGLYQFKVRKVTHPIRVYDPSLNIETTDTLVIP